MRGRSLKVVFILLFCIAFHSCYAKSIVIDNSIDLRGDTLRFPTNHVVLFENNSVISNGVIVSNNNRFKNAKLRNVTIVGEISKVDGCWYADGDCLMLKNFQCFLNSVSMTNSKGYFSKDVSVDISNYAIIKDNTNVDFKRCILYKAGGLIVNEGYLKETFDTENICLKNLTIRNKGRQRTTALLFIGVKNLKVQNLEFYDDSVPVESDGLGDWCMRLQGIDITLDKIHIDNYKSGIWADGIHAERVENFKLTNFNIQSGDDCIAIHNNMNDSKHNIHFDDMGYCGFIPQRTKNVIVKNGILRTYMARVLFMGAEECVDRDFYIEDVLFSDIKTIAGESGQGIHIIDLRKSSKCPIRNIEYNNVALSFNTCSVVIGIDGHNPIGVENIKYYKVKGVNDCSYQNNHINHGILMNYAQSVTVEKCKLASANKYPMSILNSKDIVFKNTSIQLLDGMNNPRIYNSKNVYFIGGSLKSKKRIQVIGSTVAHTYGSSFSIKFNQLENSKVIYE